MSGVQMSLHMLSDRSKKTPSLQLVHVFVVPSQVRQLTSQASQEPIVSTDTSAGHAKWQLS